MPNEDPKPIDEAALDDPAMVDLAVAILDGTPVEWSAVETGVRAGDEAMLRQLRVLAGIGALHRSLPSAQSAAAVVPVGSPPGEGLGHWGPLTLVERIGEGAFGEVFRARDGELHREVALKLLCAGRDADAASPLTEGRLLARVRHPNVVTVYGGASHDGRAGLWMEVVRGQTLAARLRQEGPLPVTDVVRIGVSLCEALSAVHAAGLLHRDVKAQNVMVEDDGRVVLMDFGAGRDESTHEADMAGTPLYLAPEVFTGRSPSVQSDIYSLGVLLFHLLTTSHPVVADTAADLAAAHAGGTRKSLTSVRPDVPARLATVIERALAPSPADRFETADAMAADLRAALSTDVRRRRRRYGLAVLGMVIVATFASLIATGALRRPPPSVGLASMAGGSSLTEHRLDLAGFSLLGPPSHDGRMLPGVGPDDRLIIVDPRTGGRRRSGDPPTPAEAYGIGTTAFSPDGRRIAYDFGEGKPDEATQIRLLDVDTMTSRQIYRSGLGTRPIGWTPDGSRLLVETPLGSGVELAWLGVATGELTPITKVGGDEGQTFSLSPDGRTVAFDLAEPPAGGQAEVFLLDALTRQVDPLVQIPSHDQYPVWTGDGSAVVFVSDRGGSSGLWKQTVTHGQPVGAPVLIFRNAGIVQPIGLDDSGVLYYVQEPQFAFWTAGIDLHLGGISAPTVAPVNVQGDNTFPDWSPDGRRVVYVASGTQRTAGLAIHDFESGAEQLFPTGSTGPPRWSPDGQSIVFPQPGSISVLAVADGHVTALPGGPFNRSLPSWSADGRSILFVDRRKDRVAVCQLDPTSGNRKVLFFAGADFGTYRSSNHGDRIAFATIEESGGRFVFSVWDGATKAVRELVRVPVSSRAEVDGWSPDDREVIIGRWSAPTVRRPLGDVELLAFPVNGGAPRSLGWLRAPSEDDIIGLRLSPTGTHVRFLTGSTEPTTWAMEGFLSAARAPGR